MKRSSSNDTRAHENAKAVSSYYAGVLSLIPLVGAIAGPIAIVLGIQALRFRSAHPEAKGAVYAAFGIALGCVGGAVWLAVGAVLVYGQFLHGDL